VGVELPEADLGAAVAGGQLHGAQQDRHRLLGPAGCGEDPPAHGRDIGLLGGYLDGPQHPLGHGRPAAVGHREIPTVDQCLGVHLRRQVRRGQQPLADRGRLGHPLGDPQRDQPGQQHLRVVRQLGELQQPGQRAPVAKARRRREVAGRPRQVAVGDAPLAARPQGDLAQLAVVVGRSARGVGGTLQLLVRLGPPPEVVEHQCPGQPRPPGHRGVVAQPEQAHPDRRVEVGQGVLRPPERPLGQATAGECAAVPGDRREGRVAPADRVGRQPLVEVAERRGDRGQCPVLGVRCPDVGEHGAVDGGGRIPGAAMDRRRGEQLIRAQRRSLPRSTADAVAAPADSADQ
jgi:hypothetical protein